MHNTFRDAFAGVRSTLEEKLTVSCGLLAELQRRHVLLQGHIDTVMVSYHRLHH